MTEAISMVMFDIPKLRYTVKPGCFSVGISHGQPILEVEECSDLENMKVVSIGYGCEVLSRVTTHQNKFDEYYLKIEVFEITKHIQKSLQNHINSIFSYSSPNELKVITENSEIPLPNIHAVSDSIISGSPVMVKDLRKFFHKFPNQNSADISLIVEGKVSKRSKLAKMENIRFQCAETFGSNYLKKFSGRNLVLQNAQVTVLDLRRFLEKWISGKKYKNLSTLCVEFADGFWIKPKNVLAEFRTEPYDEEKRPGVYHYDSKISNHNTSEVNCTSTAYTDIWRASDQKRATIRMPAKLFKFPSIVQEEILGQMKFIELFYLSLTGAQAKNLIRMFKFDIFKLQYSLTSHQPNFLAYYDTLTVSGVRNTAKGKVVILEVREAIWQGKRREKVIIGNGHEAWAVFMEDAMVMTVTDFLRQAIHQHLNSLFNYPNKENQFVGNLKASLCFKNLTEVFFSGPEQTFRGRRLENFLTLHPNLKSVGVDSTICGWIEKTSRLFTMESLSLNYQEGDHVLERFKGRYLRLNQTRVSDEILVRFLNKWISNEGYHDLESVVLKRGEDWEANGENIMDRIEHKIYDGNNPRPQNYKYDPNFVLHKPVNINLCTSAFVEVRRKSDGRRAFVCSNFHEFLMYVV